MHDIAHYSDAAAAALEALGEVVTIVDVLAEDDDLALHEFVRMLDDPESRPLWRHLHEALTERLARLADLG